MAKYAMRCANKKACGRRFTLDKPPHRYYRPVKCPHCKGHNVLDVNATVQNERARNKREGRTCYCTGYPFPHRDGTLRFCKGHPSYGLEPSAQELRDYDNTIDTPRG